MADLKAASPIGFAANALGSIFNAFGTSQRSDAIKKMTRKNQRLINDFAYEFNDESAENKVKKDNILASSSDVFDRLGGFIFGETDSLSNLRDAQENFSEMAAGNFDNFSQETQSLISSALANTHGGPQGSFENLSAKNLFDFRSKGLQNALAATNNLSTLGNNLISTEFGVMDQDFERRLKIGQYRVEQNIAQQNMRAGVEGSTMAGIGNSLSTLGQGYNSYQNAQNQLQIANSSMANTNAQTAHLNSLLGAPRATVIEGPPAQNNVSLNSSAPVWNDDSSFLGGVFNSGLSYLPNAIGSAFANSPYGQAASFIGDRFGMSGSDIADRIETVGMLPPLPNER